MLRSIAPTTHNKLSQLPKTFTFTSEEATRVIQPHNDALVVTLQIANHNIHPVLVDIRSSVDILFLSAYNQMELPPTILKPVDAPLYSFSNHSIRPNKGVKLLVTAGCHPTQAIVLSNFLVMDTLGVNNAMIGRPTLNALRIVASTYHLALKFLTLTKVRFVHGNQVKAHCCYALALKR